MRGIFRFAMLALASALVCAGFAQEEEVKPDKLKEDLPLQGTETIEFTTDEVTWMSLDVSPDGSTIVFDLLGDLYTLPIMGGEARKIVGGISFEGQPRFSPDGEKIVFTSDRSGADNVWIADADGDNAKALTKGRNSHYFSPDWTPDGKYIVVSKMIRGQVSVTMLVPTLRMYHVDGGSGLTLSSQASGSGGFSRQFQMGAVASPDGRYVYFAFHNGRPRRNAMFPIWQVSRYDLRTGDTQRLTNAQGSAMRPAISPDGEHMVYATRFETQTGLRVRNLVTHEERWLAYPVTRDDQESVASRDTYPGYSFMPDGKSLIVPVNGKIARIDFKSGKMTDIPFTAKVSVKVNPTVHFDYKVESGDQVTARLVRWAKLSPSGTQVAFTAFNKLWVQDLPSGEPKRLTQSEGVGEFMPAWTPDGKEIVYVTWSGNGGSVMKVSADGGTPMKLTHTDAYYSDPAVTLDGKRIVFTMGNAIDHMFSIEPDGRRDGILPETGDEEIGGFGGGMGRELVWMPIYGGRPTTIGPARGSSPHFVKDQPERVYLTSRGSLTSVRFDGLDRKTHLTVSASTGGGGGGRGGGGGEAVIISPDGGFAFVSAAGRHYIVTIPPSGDQTLSFSLPGGPAPVKKMSEHGGDYLGWSSDGRSVTWSWGATFYIQDVKSDEPHETPIKVTMPRAKPEGTVVLSGARLVTMNGDEVIESGDIVVTDNRIVAVGPKGTVAKPAGAKVIDVTGKTIIPGFVDIHAHLRPPRNVLQLQNWSYLANLAYGVTTTRDPQSGSTDVFSYMDLMDTGQMIGPRIFSTGPGVFSRSGLTDKDAAFRYIKRYRDAYNSQTLKQYMSGDRIVRQWIAMACREYSITPTTEGGLDLKLNLTHMFDGYSGHEHSLPVHPLYKDVTEFVARTKTFYTPTLLVAYGAPWTENYFYQHTDVHGNMKLRRFVPHALLDGMTRRRGQWFLPEEYGHEGIARGLRDVVRAGGRVGLGSHGQLQGLGAHWEIWAMQSGGMTEHEALKCATIFGAEAIGLISDLGSLEAGKLADLIVLDENPLDDIRNTNTIRYVMKNGELFFGDTLDQIWPVRKMLPKMFWQDLDPPTD
ncbi:MAG: PD40 domain-containing protein [Armatimonadetes bacterium]|nr:PD40 domain-containing protein [Armatimonadota bacterium]